VLPLDRLQGHLVGSLKLLLEKNQREKHTKIVALTSKRRLYVANKRVGDLINVCDCDHEKK
jgi:hypothetical protein